MKKFITTAALAALLGAPALGETISLQVEIPTQLQTEAELETARQAVLDAATTICDDVEYVGLAEFYRVRLQRECVADAYAEALAAEQSGRLLAYAEGRDDQLLVLAQR